ncbi:WD40-repeat-containing domain protein [Dichotomocladium elegans]|nr:WD40-repeat-containing domain protein [Dichotomocladium elegans]
MYTLQSRQLRNLIRSPGPSSVYHPCVNGLNLFDTRTGQDKPILSDLLFTPIALDTAFGYIAVAGQRGMGLVKEISGSWSARFSAGPGMNNSICLSKHKDQIRTIVCNNDHTVSVFDVPSMEKISYLKMPSAINHASVSPDGQKVLFVGDNGMVYLYQITESGDYQSTSIYRASEEPALSCAWNHSSNKFAVSSQDGTVSVWKVENTEPLLRIPSTEIRKTRKAARAIQFSKSPLDLLIYTEHVSNINIVDTRTFETRQVLRLSPADVDRHITGLALSPDNRFLFVGLEDSIIQFSVDVCARRRFGSARIC